MWRSHGHPRRMKNEPLSNAHTEASIDKRDQSIRNLVEELVSGTRELKSKLYGGEEHANPQ